MPFEQGVGGMPLDVEKLRVGAGAPPGQQVQPPRVVSTAHRHVIGHHIEDQPHVMGAQLGHQAPQRSFTTERGADAGRIDHVVAVHRPVPRRQQRRCVEVADAHARKVRHLQARIVQGETCVKLQALGGAQNRCAQCVHSSRSCACRRAQASSSRRRATWGRSSKAAHSTGRRRRQLG